MRRAPLFASSLALVLAAGTAAATVTEPNTMQVPIDSSAPPNSNGEVQIYTLFQNQADPVDWQADAHTTPNAFSPLCGFTATFVLHQAGSYFDFGWYNETGQPPQASDIHVLLPAGTPVGTSFNGTSIKNDPTYAGGLVGFALKAADGPHCTNPQYNASFAANQPWILALIYASKTTPNAYYIAFEDGAAGAGYWNNDGDFNDDVFFLTGITCSGGGEPCDTGKPGICGPGLTQCTSNGVVCQQLSQPSPTESCNGIDDDCNDVVDEGDLCPSGFVCDKGTCVQSCQGGEFNCPPNKVCNNATGYCVDPACKDVDCPVGKVCVGGTCTAPCDGVTCPYPQVCRVGACVDPCAGVTCESGQVCDGGVCVTRCDCQPCAAGKACDATSGQCLDPACVGVSCNAGTHCAGGTCVDDCDGATCPAGQTCTAGQCVAEMTSSSSSSSSSGIFGTGGSGGGASSSSGGGGGAGGAMGTGGSGGGSGGSGAASGGGSKSTCGCRVVGDDDGSDGAWAAIALMGLAAMRRRRSAR